MKIKLLFVSLLITNLAISQTTLFFEDFETPSTTFSLNTSDLGGATGATGGLNRWIINNNYSGGSANLSCIGFQIPYTVTSTPSQATQITNSPNSTYMHIISSEARIDGFLGASHFGAEGLCFLRESNFLKMSTSVVTTGFASVSINFWWLCGGGLEVSGQLYYSVDGGNTWVLNTSNYYNQPTWSLASVTNPVWGNQPDLRFAFRFSNVNDTGSASTLGFSIDDVKILATTLSTEDFKEQAKLNIYPNPATNTINIDFQDLENANVAVLDMNGRVLMTQKLSNNSNSINIENLASGMYLFKVTSNEGTATSKVIKN